ncbi:uncharacterized protein [Antedon mediterranea]|uniref:uncharacterized protein isoform X2 n=1 Tax=Antedon mediterranea TaxID=105859 RepID=UPI003AF75A34
MPIEKCTYEENPYHWFNLEALQRLCPHDDKSEALPVFLILNELSSCRQSCYTIGHSRLVEVNDSSNSVLVESVLVREDYRGCGIGKLLMDLTEQCCKKLGYKTVYVVATNNAEEFYKHIGYTGCSSVPTKGAQMLSTCKMKMDDGSCSDTSNCAGSTECKKMDGGSCSDTSNCAGPTECKKAKKELTSDMPQNETTCAIWMKKDI